MTYLYPRTEGRVYEAVNYDFGFFLCIEMRFFDGGIALHFELLALDGVFASV